MVFSPEILGGFSVEVFFILLLFCRNARQVGAAPGGFRFGSGGVFRAFMSSALAAEAFRGQAPSKAYGSEQIQVGDLRFLLFKFFLTPCLLADGVKLLCCSGFGRVGSCA